MLKLTKWVEKFGEDPREYKTNPKGHTLDKIRWLENEIETRTLDFQKDPQWYVNEWEELTDQIIPEHYVSDISQQVTANMFEGIGKPVGKRFVVELLPLINEDGTPAEYPEERLWAEPFLEQNQRIYFLIDGVLDELNYTMI